MSPSRSEPAARLAELLETLPAKDRQEITAWLLTLGRAPGSTPFGLPWPGGGPLDRHRLVAGALPAGEDSQLVTIRLPAERHAELRNWCAEHSFTMAAVVRGLVERFLEEQLRATAG